MIAGIDEAGRGPVIGPMVMAILATDDEKALKKLGARDSKDIPPEKRECLAETLADMPHEIITLQPDDIDTAVQKDGDNLNKLEARTSARLVHALAQRVPIERAIVDSPTKSTEKYEAEIRNALRALDKDGFTEKIRIQCEIKADANYPVVGGASILAKVTRDAAIRQLEQEHGPLGSGYPSDPATQRFLDGHWREGHDFFRKSWASYQRLAKSAGQTTLTPAENKEDIAAFSILKEHGFAFAEPTNPYETVRMRNGRTTVIKYTTGKVVVQGQEKDSVEKLLKKLGLR